MIFRKTTITFIITAVILSAFFPVLSVNKVYAEEGDSTVVSSENVVENLLNSENETQQTQQTQEAQETQVEEQNLEAQVLPQEEQNQEEQNEEQDEGQQEQQVSLAQVLVASTPNIPSAQCLLPNTFGDSVAETVNPGVLGTLQERINAAGYQNDVNTDQKQYQNWVFAKNSTTFEVEYLGQGGGVAAGNIFGYYLDENPNNFVPVFRAGNQTVEEKYNSLPVFSQGQKVSITVTSGAKIAFGLVSDFISTDPQFPTNINFVSTENNKNSDSNDHAVVYDAFTQSNALPGDYIIGFEDRVAPYADNNFNDVIVRVHEIGCENISTPPDGNPGGSNGGGSNGGGSTNLTPFFDLTCKITSPDQTGWYGTYYNYSSTTVGMEIPMSKWPDDKNGEPINSNATSSIWFSNQFARFNRVDANLDFGNNFFPFDSHPEELISGHDFHFGVRWSAKVFATTTGLYGFSVSSDDDVWIYVNGVLILDNQGIHGVETVASSTVLNAGENRVDIYFNERHTTNSYMSFGFNDTNLLIKPYSQSCPLPVNTPPTITLIGANPLNITVGTQFVDPGATATDTEDGNLTSVIVRTGSVNASTTGTYTLTYVVKDSGNLYATTTRVVNVNPVVCTSNCGGGGSNTPTVTLNSNPGTIDKGASSTLTWVSTNTTSCSAVWTSATSTSGSASVAPTATTEYAIACTGSNGSVSATTTVNVNTPSNPPVNPPGGGGGGGGGIGGRRHPVVVGEILGATSCFYLRDYLKIDWQNDPIEVLKLQSFLNVFEKENLSLTGVFDRTTFEAVERFQVKYSSDILEPWGDKVTTGFVYILTKKKINEIYCNTLINLNQADKDEIEAFRNSGSAASGNTGFISGSSDIGSNLQTSEVADIVIKDTDESPVVVLKDKSLDDSIIRNAAISLFAIPQKLFGRLFNSCNSASILLFLILIALLVIIARLFMGGNKKGLNPIIPPAAANTAAPIKDSPVIILPGVLPDEEIVIEDSGEDLENIAITTPDLRDGK